MESQKKIHFLCILPTPKVKKLLHLAKVLVFGKSGNKKKKNLLDLLETIIGKITIIFQGQDGYFPLESGGGRDKFT